MTTADITALITAITALLTALAAVCAQVGHILRYHNPPAKQQDPAPVEQGKPGAP